MSEHSHREEPDAPFEERGVYEQDCPKCGRHHRVLSQYNYDTSEYMTTVATFCECGEKLVWRLPVN